MRKWATEFIALDARTGQMKTWIGEYVHAPTWLLAQQWCDDNKGYLKVTGELESEIPCKGDSFEPDWENEVRYSGIQNN